MVRPRDLNSYQKVFGGYVIERVDDLATGLVAALSGRAAVTAHLDRLTFTSGIAAFQRMRVQAQATRTFRSSMEVVAEVSGEDPLTGRVWSTARAALTVVGLDASGRPAALPTIEPTTESERQAYASAGQRRRARLAARGAPVWTLPDPQSPRADPLSLATCTRLITGRHATDAGQARAGWILALADELAAISASRHAALPCVTVAVDDVAFLRPVPVGDVVELHAYLTATFRTSLEVRVEVWRRRRYARTRDAVACCAFTYVALDAEGRPTAVPPFVPVGEAEAALAGAARRRRAARP